MSGGQQYQAISKRVGLEGILEIVCQVGNLLLRHIRSYSEALDTLLGFYVIIYTSWTMQNMTPIIGYRHRILLV